MALNNDTTSRLDKIDAAIATETSEVSALVTEVKSLREQVKTGISGEELDSRLEQIEARITGIYTPDPVEAPAPVETPVVVTEG